MELSAEQQTFVLEDILPIHTRLLEREVRKRVKSVHKLGKRRITLHKFPPKLFKRLWPDEQAVVEFQDTIADKAAFFHHLAPIISPDLLTKTTSDHLDEPNCGIQNCDHKEQVMLTTPSKILYNTRNEKLTIHGKLQTKSFGCIFHD
jgi:hypothetical protein